MRFFAPLLLGAAATAMAETTAQDVLAKEIPQCMQSCVGNAIGDAIGCSLADNDCVCSADTPSADKANSVIKDVSTCATNSNCTMADAKKLANIDFQKIYTQGMKSICDDTGDAAALTATNLVFAVGTMAFLAFV